MAKVCANFSSVPKQAAEQAGEDAGDDQGEKWRSDDGADPTEDGRDFNAGGNCFLALVGGHVGGARGLFMMVWRMVDSQPM